MSAPVEIARFLLPGEPAPWFTAPALDANPNWVFSSIGGLTCLMLFHGSAAQPEAAAALAAVAARRDLFDDQRAAFFGITIDPTDAREKRIAQQLPGLRHFLDYDRKVSALYGACPSGAAEQISYRPHFLLLDRTLQIVARFGLNEVAAALDATAALAAAPRQDWAPVIEVPRILEPEICEQLIAGYRGGGGEVSGFMREIEGKTRLVVDPEFKRREDWTIADPKLRQALVARLRTRLVPAIRRAFQFEATRVERYIVARYAEDDAGFFRAHRDNTTRGTAHRRFAVTINLNSDYDGGDLRFPEFGARSYRAPVGGAVVFSCSLLHEALPVTRGERFAFLPFLYDEAAAQLRETNNDFLGDEVGRYRAGAAAASGASNAGTDDRD